jgi:hypothetical protein
MTKETAFSIVRAALTLTGSYIIGHNLFGAKLDESLWQELAGAAITIISIVWGIVDKSATIESIQSAVRSVITVAGGLLVSAGKLTGDALNSIIGLVAVLVPLLQSWLSKKKVQQLADGTLAPSSNGKVVKPASTSIGEALPISGN